MISSTPGRWCNMAKDKAPASPAEQLLRKWAEESENGQAMLPDFDADFSASFPNLWVLLTWRQVGVMEKQPGSITFRVDGTGWRVQYFDPTAKRSCAVVAETVLGGLKKLDLAVVAPDTVWTGGNRRGRTWRKLES